MHLIKKIATQVYICGTSPIRWAWGRSLTKSIRYPIASLFYHRVADQYPNPWTISTKRFEEQMVWLQRNFDVVSLEEVQRRMVEGSDRPTVSITFDDGYADNCFTAIPYLIKNNIPFTYFVSSDFVLRGGAFPHDQERGVPLAPNGIESLKLLDRAGVEIGAHTRTHPDLGKVTDAETLFDEVVTARDELEKEIDCKINYFAFPYGQMENLNDEAIQLAKTHGFKGVCSAYGGLNSVGDNPFHIHRLHGDSETIRLKNWLSLDPRVLLAKKYQLPELPESTNETSNQEASDETKSDQVAATSC